MYSYSAYGIGLHSVLPLPELTACRVEADVEIRFGSLTELRSKLPVELADETIYYHYWNSENGICLYWKDVAIFSIRNGREITIDPVPGVEERRLRLILLGAVLSILLHQRGYLVFHASALAVNGSAIIFLGDKGWGKSTMAAALHNRGHSFMADDVVAIDDRVKNTHTVLPAFPQIKLWSDAIYSMGDNPDRFAKISSLVDKRDYRLADGFLNNPVPLKCVYVLGVSDKISPEIRPLKPQEALIRLIAQTYNARWGKKVFAEDSASHLFRCSEIVKNIPVCLLTRPKSLELMPTIAQLVEEHTQNNVFD